MICNNQFKLSYTYVWKVLLSLVVQIINQIIMKHKFKVREAI